MKRLLRWKGLVFEHYVREDGFYWAYACNDCLSKHGIPEEYIGGTRRGVCDIENCDAQKGLSCVVIPYEEAKIEEFIQ